MLCCLFFGRLNYTFNDRYLLQQPYVQTVLLNLPRVIVSYFPSAAAAWRVSEEGFWKDNAIGNVVNNFKLRVGYGTTGNCNIDNICMLLLIMLRYILWAIRKSAALAPGSTVGNNNLKWGRKPFLRISDWTWVWGKQS